MAGGQFPTVSDNDDQNLVSIAEFLMANGFSRAAAAGVAGTSAGEGGGNPEESGAGGWGLIGWTPPTQGSPYGQGDAYHGSSNLGGAPNSNPGVSQATRQSDFDHQLDDILGYANQNSAEAVARGGVPLASLETASDPVQAGKWWSMFEGPQVPGSDERSGTDTSIYNALSSYSPNSGYKALNIPGGGGSTGSGAAPAQAILDSFPGGAIDPLNWPSEAGKALGGAAGAAEAGVGSAIEGAIMGVWGTIMKSLGFKSGKDFLVRMGLILIGAIILIIGIKSLASSGSGTSSSGSAVFSGADDSGVGEGSGSDESGGAIAGRAHTGSSHHSTSGERSAASHPSPSKPSTIREGITGSPTKHTKGKSLGMGPSKAIGKDAIEGAVAA